MPRAFAMSWEGGKECRWVKTWKCSSRTWGGHSTLSSRNEKGDQMKSRQEVTHRDDVADAVLFAKHFKSRRIDDKTPAMSQGHWGQYEPQRRKRMCSLTCAA